MSPIAIVDNASMIEDLESPLKSIDTRGRSQYPKIPFNSPSLASFNAEFTSSIVAPFLSVQTKSTRETVGVGTLTENPFNLPSYCGKTFATAFAAPVVVGIIDSAAALALLKSLWVLSNNCWSFV